MLIAIIAATTVRTAVIVYVTDIYYWMINQDMDIIGVLFYYSFHCMLMTKSDSKWLTLLGLCLQCLRFKLVFSQSFNTLPKNTRFFIK